MTRIACRIKDCPNAYETEEAVSPNASYICKDHPREVQVRAVPGRRYNSATDEADKDIHFQDHQFDKNLGGAVPEGGDREDSMRLRETARLKREGINEQRPERA